MSLNSTVTEVTYNCDGATKEFPITFGFFQRSDIQCYLIDATTGNETLLTEGTDYSISTIYNDYRSGGTLTTVHVYDYNKKIDIKRVIDITQELDFTKYDAFRSEDVEDGLDKLTMISQQISAINVLNQSALEKKADKIVTPIEGNLLEQDDEGNLKDTGIPASNVSLHGHTHVASDVTNFQQAVSQNTDVVTAKNHADTTGANPHQTKFNQLSDVPDYTGAAGKVAVVNATEDGIQFSDVDADTHWGDINGFIDNQLDLKAKLDAKFDKADHINTSTGASDAGKPIVLNNQGLVDDSMLGVPGFVFIGDFTPTSSNEYPDATGYNYGAFWMVDGLSSDYTFTGGDLAGKTASNGDYMLWGDTGWSLKDDSLEASDYYKLDGSQAITSPFAGGGQRVTNIADGIDAQDAVAFGQLKNAILTESVGDRRARQLPSGTDFNAVTSGGYYYILGDGSNKPLGLPEEGGYLVVIRKDNDNIMQVCTDFNRARSYVRVKNISGWSTWRNYAWQDEINVAEWGNITGSIANQTDLYNALTNKEDNLGNPAQNGYMLTSDTAGNRAWIPQPDVNSLDESYIMCLAWMCK